MNIAIVVVNLVLGLARDRADGEDALVQAGCARVARRARAAGGEA